jgi:hypothetical protein
MGQHSINVEMVTDYSTRQGCVRLHIDFPMPNNQMQKLRALMDSGNHKDAFGLVRENAREDNYRVVEAFEQAFANLKK